MMQGFRRIATEQDNPEIGLNLGVEAKPLQ
jgi:hypothetical protein